MNRQKPSLGIELLTSIHWAQENLRAICGHLRTQVACQLRTERKYLRSLACRPIQLRAH
ncbi:uncharacterized protein LACBIDRAFT_307577 [Laccaria bicolor S238N-H82]|uniref:Predicted protein n=1 Tax=Laccaria bicolor (strain S238N-H82 / ATCC MYA-4686) TaxID=486041 RepID=B0DQG8_LACBS|nr:uncharacterized protein LACBIDRAFT_307577 [Laccaria bicolor S238N-H82]EDR03107.1 predicted protein [Laccaria bicolor S238N-H82]|eukprot:XP_001886248.1 predicted protein [Laccaria bicolor S238N-H82]